MKIPCAVLGSGNIGTDLLLKIQTRSDVLGIVGGQEDMIVDVALDLVRQRSLTP